VYLLQCRLRTMWDVNSKMFIFSHAHAATGILALPKVNNNPWNYIIKELVLGSIPVQNIMNLKRTACRSQIVWETPWGKGKTMMVSKQVVLIVLQSVTYCTSGKKKTNKQTPLLYPAVALGTGCESVQELLPWEFQMTIPSSDIEL